MVKTDQKKVQSQIFFLLVPLGTIAQLFMKKKISHFTITLNSAYEISLDILSTLIRKCKQKTEFSFVIITVNKN